MNSSGVFVIVNSILETYKGFSKDVVIPEGVESIGSYAFQYYQNSLTSVVIPNSVTSIEDWAFENCRSLITAEIPDSVTSIGDHAFEGCSNVTGRAANYGAWDVGPDLIVDLPNE